MTGSKALGHDDSSGFLFAQEMLNGDVTAAINFDRLQHDRCGYIIFEYLLCDEEQVKKHKTTPYNSHPNRYMSKNEKKFISLWKVAQALNARLYLVNYAKQGTICADEILLMRVNNVTGATVETKDYRFTRKAFSDWFRKLNTACLNNGVVPPDNYQVVYNGFIHNKRSCQFIINKQSKVIRIVETDIQNHPNWRYCIYCDNSLEEK